MINHDQLELKVVMSNAGLPEAGDAVLTFPDELLADPQKYQDAASLPQVRDEGARARAARARRDLAIEGYGQLVADLEQHGQSALDRFHTRAAALVKPRVRDWQRIWERNVHAETQRTATQLQALATGKADHLSTATVFRGEPRPEPQLWGMCGRLQTWTGHTAPPRS